MHPYGPEFYGPDPYWLRSQPPSQYSGYATASLVLGIFGIFGGWCLFGLPCLLAIILGHIGYAETKGGRLRGREAAFWGAALGYLIVVPAVIFGIFFLVPAISR